MTNKYFFDIIHEFIYRNRYDNDNSDDDNSSNENDHMIDNRLMAIKQCCINGDTHMLNFIFKIDPTLFCAVLDVIDFNQLFINPEWYIKELYNIEPPYTKSFFDLVVLEVKNKLKILDHWISGNKTTAQNTLNIRMMVYNGENIKFEKKRERACNMFLKYQFFSLDVLHSFKHQEEGYHTSPSDEEYIMDNGNSIEKYKWDSDKEEFGISPEYRKFKFEMKQKENEEVKNRPFQDNIMGAWNFYMKR